MLFTELVCALIGGSSLLNKRSNILAVIPAYQEEASLPHVLTELREVRPDIDVLVVDDGSTDKTAEVAKLCGAKVISLPFNLGIGGAVQTGLHYASRRGYEVAIQFDADGQHLASEIESILKPVLCGLADVVIGSRFLSSGGFKSSLTRRLGIRFFEWVVRAAIRQRITDPTSGFRAFNHEAIVFLAKDYPCDYPEVEAVVVLARSGFRLLEVPVRMRERIAGRSSIRALHSVYYMIKVLLAIFMSVARRSFRSTS